MVPILLFLAMDWIVLSIFSENLSRKKCFVLVLLNLVIESSCKAILFLRNLECFYFSSANFVLFYLLLEAYSRDLFLRSLLGKNHKDAPFYWNHKMDAPFSSIIKIAFHPALTYFYFQKYTYYRCCYSSLGIIAVT